MIECLEKMSRMLFGLFAVLMAYGDKAKDDNAEETDLSSYCNEDPTQNLLRMIKTVMVF